MTPVILPPLAAWSNGRVGAGLGRRLARERRTIDAMIGIFCRDRHAGTRGRLCADCRALRDYAEQRLLCCPFGSEKPTCANCRVHCYSADMRDRVRAVMRHAGPRMLVRHPFLAIMHKWVDHTRDAPERPPRRSARARNERVA